MIGIVNKRGTGKTSRLLLIAKDCGSTLVVPTFKHQQFVQDRAVRLFGKDHGIKIITAHEFLSDGFHGDPDESFLIDDLECILQERHVVGYSMSIKGE